MPAETKPWESIGNSLHRMWVPGGWLVRYDGEVLDPIAMERDGRREGGFEWRPALCFVPDQFHRWLEEPVEEPTGGFG